MDAYNLNESSGLNQIAHLILEIVKKIVIISRKSLG